MRFDFDTSDPIVQALLKYAQFDKEALEIAMTRAYEKREHGYPVTIESIKEEIDFIFPPKKVSNQ